MNENDLKEILKALPSAALALIGTFAFVWGFALLIAILC